MMQRTVTYRAVYRHGNFIMTPGTLLRHCCYSCCVRYEMTPTRVKVIKPSTADNYDISDLHSDDDTDNEDEPRKKIPAWALGMFAS